MRRLRYAPVLVLCACAHANRELVVTLPTLGPRLLFLTPDEPLRVSGPGAALCVAVPEGGGVTEGRLHAADDAGIDLEVQLADEDGRRVDLPSARLKLLAEGPYLCLSPREPLAVGVTFDRIRIQASAAFLAPDIRWLPRSP